MAKKKKPAVTEREVRMARAFLAAIGGNQTNGYLLLAVIAWARQMRSAHDPFWQRMKGLSNIAAGRALAVQMKRRLIGQGRAGEYRQMLKALRRKASTDTQRYGQATDFLLDLDKSHYDSHHYGYTPAHAAYTEYKQVWHQTSAAGSGYYTTEPVYHPAAEEHDPLATTWGKLLNHPIPPKWFVDVVQPPRAHTAAKTKTIPAQPRSLQHVLPATDYIQPYAAVHFYEARPHLGEYVLPNG